MSFSLVCNRLPHFSETIFVSRACIFHWKLVTDLHATERLDWLPASQVVCVVYEPYFLPEVAEAW